MKSRHLALLRHAKSSWDDPDLDDHDRPLTGRGRRAAASIGKYMRRKGIVPDLVLCSSATRAVQTLKLLQLGPGPEILIEDELYGASVAEMLARLRRVPDRVASVLLIGHNPGIFDLAVTLADDQQSIDAFPTAALADLRLPLDSWADLFPNVATVHAFVTPRSL